MSFLHLPGSVGQWALEEALQTQAPTERHRKPDQRVWRSSPFNVHWPSGIPALDALLDGGPHGVTAIASEGKVGKSMLAIGSALEAAATLDWRVAFFVGELDESEWDEREARYIAAHPAVGEGLALLRVYHVRRGVTPEELVLLANEESGPEPLLIVLDSINTIASLSGRPYYAMLEELSVWAMMARRLSAGAVSFLLVAETNVRGGIKGERLQFWADAIVRLERPKEREAAEKGWVDVEVTHSRRTRSGYVGRFLRDKPTESFRAHGDHLRVVGSV